MSAPDFAICSRSLTRQAETIAHKRQFFATALRLLEEQDSPSPRREEEGRIPDLNTNVDRAIYLLHAVAPHELTLLQLIEKSAENAKKAFVGTSISSQLRFQEKRGFIKKKGDAYYAVMGCTAATIDTYESGWTGRRLASAEGRKASRYKSLVLSRSSCAPPGMQIWTGFYDESSADSSDATRPTGV